jgi:Fe-S-cluster containining protein
MKFTESICSCYSCKEACRTLPCWPTPKESQALIDKGFGARLMCDYWVGDGPNGNDIEIISPAIVDYESCHAPLLRFGRCTFLTKDDLCKLHNI